MKCRCLQLLDGLFDHIDMWMEQIVELAVKLNSHSSSSVAMWLSKRVQMICNGDYCTHAAIGLSPLRISGKQSASLLIIMGIDWSAARSFQ